MNVDLLNSLVDETSAQLKELERQINEAETELKALEFSAEEVQREYSQLIS